MGSCLKDSMRDFLAEKRFAVLATLNRDGTAQQSVMWYALEGDIVRMNTKRGRLKERNMRRDPRISICVEDEYDFITLRGRAELIDDQDVAQADIKRLAERYHGAERAERMAAEQFSKEHRVTVLMAIEGVASDGF